MRLTFFNRQKTLLPLLTLTLLLIFMFSSCARKLNFTTSSIVPAAEGSVKVKKDNNNNYAIKVDVKHLAEPKRLQQPKEVYVVWIETPQNGVQNIGQLKTSSGLLSRTLKASLETTSPFKPNRIFITAEDQSNIQYPSSYVILNTNSF